MGDLPNKPLLRVEEVAAYWTVTTRTVYSWVQHGLMESVRTPRGIRITRESAVKPGPQETEGHTIHATTEP